MSDKNPIPVFARRLREAREVFDISQQNLGIKIGIDEFAASPRINRYEMGVHQPALAIQQLLADALELPLAYFYAHDDELAQLIATFETSRKGRKKS